MRVLAKPELENSIILNEFVMIMENFGVMDQLDDDDSDDYIPDTEQSVCHSMTDLHEKEEDNIKDETAKEAKITDNAPVAEGTKDEEKDAPSKNRLPRKHNMENIDAKGIKILRKVARFLLK